MRDGQIDLRDFTSASSQHACLTAGPDHMTTQMDLDETGWTNAVRRGVRWLFWVALISAALVNASGFALPFIGGTRRHLMWVAVFPAFAAMGIAYAVLLVTVREPGCIAVRSDRGAMLRIIAIANAMAHLVAPISMALADPADTNYFLVAKNLLRLGLASLFFLYVRSLATRFGMEKMTRTAGTLAWLFPAASLALPLGSDIFGAAMDSNRTIFLCSSTALNLTVGIWALYFIWRFGSSMPSAARGRCVRCGYCLSGSAENRCSECGTPFSQAWRCQTKAD